MHDDLHDLLFTKTARKHKNTPSKSWAPVLPSQNGACCVTTQQLATKEKNKIQIIQKVRIS